MHAYIHTHRPFRSPLLPHWNVCFVQRMTQMLELFRILKDGSQGGLYCDPARISAVGIRCIGRPCQVNVAGPQVGCVLHGGEECSCRMLHCSVVAPNCAQPCKWGNRKVTLWFGGCISERKVVTKLVSTNPTPMKMGRSWR